MPDQTREEDINIIAEVIDTQRTSFALAAANAAPDALGNDGLDGDRRVIQALQTAHDALKRSTDPRESPPHGPESDRERSNPANAGNDTPARENRSKAMINRHSL